jgi:hypothetical protein
MTVTLPRRLPLRSNPRPRHQPRPSQKSQPQYFSSIDLHQASPGNPNLLRAISAPSASLRYLFFSESARLPIRPMNFPVCHCALCELCVKFFPQHKSATPAEARAPAGNRVSPTSSSN